MSAAPSSVVDASALLALLLREPGWQRCRQALGRRPVMSAVNWSEVSQKVRSRGVDGGEVLRAVSRAGLDILPLTRERAEEVARLWTATRGLGLSLADRACLALAAELDRPAVTADRTWTDLPPIGIAVQCIR